MSHDSVFSGRGETTNSLEMVANFFNVAKEGPEPFLMNNAIELLISAVRANMSECGNANEAASFNGVI